MNHSYSSDQPLPETNWKSLGELKLQTGSNPDGTIKAWLMHIIEDLQLPGKYVSRLLASIEEATLRILSPEGIEDQFDHLEIILLAQSGQVSKGHTWGFFRVERTSTDSKIESAKGYCFEYYLYLEGKPGK